MTTHNLVTAALIALVGAMGCSTPGEELRQNPPSAITQLASQDAADVAPADGTLGRYVAIALDGQPSLARHADLWRASTYDASAVSVWPRTTLTYGFSPLPVETRLGPQRHRLGVRQGIPWPGRATARAQAAAAHSDVELARLNATADQLVRDVGVAYWDLWEARQRGVILSEQLTVLETSARIARGGIEVGSQGLGSVTRIELAASRLRDRQSANSARIAAAEARLRGALARDLPTLPTTPAPFEPITFGDEWTDVSQAPAIVAQRRQVDAATKAAEAAELASRPDFSLGVDWILVDEGSAMADDAGRDAVMLMLGIHFPVDFGAESARVDAAKMRGSAASHSVDASLIDRRAQARAELEMARDAARRTTFYRTTLLPQAETAFEAALGDYEAGQASVADILLAQREWLELAVGEVEARASYERAVIRLQTLTGSGDQNE